MFTNQTLAPLLYDALEPTSSPWVPLSHNSSALVTETPGQPTWEQVDPIFWSATSNGFDFIVMGIAMTLLRIKHPDSITERETSYPKRYFALLGFLRASNQVLIQYAMPGERTPPYLRVILNRMGIPMMFGLRLAKRYLK